MRAFDSSELERYKAEAQEKWGRTDAYREYDERAKGRSGAEQQGMAGIGPVGKHPPAPSCGNFLFPV